MDENIIIASFHEAGHAIISYIVGWTIDTIKLQVENDILVNAVTKYDFGNDTENSIINLNRRVFCLVGGPISEAFYRNENSINLNILGQDGITIDNLLNGISLPEKEKIIQQALNDVATLLNSENSQNASQEISKILIEKRSLSAIEFNTIMENNNIKRMKF
jgi:hypothetical protein